MIQYTSILTSDGSPISYKFKETNVTGFAGAPLLVDGIRRSKLFKSMVELFAVITGRTANINNVYYDEDLLLESLLMYGLNCGDISDVKLLNHDPLIKELLGKIASPATLSRYYEEIDRGCRFLRGEAVRPDFSHLPKHDKRRIGSEFFNAANDTLLRYKLQCMKEEYMYLAGTKIHIPRKFIILDVDSTFIELHGQQQEKAYCGKNKANGYFPLLMFVDGAPVFIHNAPGATDGRKLLQDHLGRVIDIIAEFFPKTKVILRGDAGFNSEQIIQICEEKGAGYITGFAQSRKLIRVLMNMLYEEYRAGEYTDGLIERLPAVLQKHIQINEGLFIQEPDPEQRVDKLCGIIKGYQAQSWTTERRLFYRIQYSQDYNEADCRFIQTNLTDSELLAVACHSGQRKNPTILDNHFGNYDTVSVALNSYYGTYCDRAICELDIREFKAVNESVSLSCKGFFANWAKLMFGVILMQILQEIKRKAFPETSCWRNKSIVSIRKWILCMPGLVRKLSRSVRIVVNELKYAMDEFWIGLMQQT